MKKINEQLTELVSFHRNKTNCWDFLYAEDVSRMFIFHTIFEENINYNYTFYPLIKRSNVQPLLRMKGWILSCLKLRPTTNEGVLILDDDVMFADHL